jgi:protein required for attachment to host cells
MKRICLLVADAARARIFTYEQLEEPDGPHELLREECDLVDPARRKRPSELFSDQAGGNHTGHRGYAFDDHRQAHIDRLDVDFAKQIAGEVERIMHDDGYRALVVIASSRMLGELRSSFENLSRTITVTELERDFTKLRTDELRARLGELNLLPPRRRVVFANR